MKSSITINGPRDQGGVGIIAIKASQFTGLFLAWPVEPQFADEQTTLWFPFYREGAMHTHFPDHFHWHFPDYFLDDLNPNLADDFFFDRDNFGFA